MRMAIVIAAIVAGGIALSMTGDPYAMRVATTALMYAGLALSWNVIGGYTGYPSFATAAFFGVGAYTAAIMQNAGLPVWQAWLAAPLLSAALAAAIGFAILRLRGHYFAVASLVIPEVLREIVNGAANLTGGGMGLNLPVIRLSIQQQGSLFLAAMGIIVIAALIITMRIDRGRLGIAFRCIEQNEAAAVMIGVNATFYKVAAFTLSGLLAGSVGGVYANWINYIDPSDVFDILISVKPIVMVLLGGAGTVYGPLLGAVAFVLLEEVVWRNFLTVHTGILGLIIVLLILFLPQGVARLSPLTLIRPLIRKPAGGEGI
jgi:branched-chain amino acid transport system permease protein